MPTRRWTIDELPWPADLPAAVRVFARGDEVAWLDSAAPEAGRDSYSLVCARPLAVLEQAEGGAARLVAGGRVLATGTRGWDLWRQIHRAVRVPSPAPLRLAPGWVGYVGFAAARELERVPAMRGESLGLPVLRMALYDRGIVLDVARRRACAVRAVGVADAHGLPPDDADREWRARWCRAADANPVPHPDGRAAVRPLRPATVQPDISRPVFEDMVTRALEYIAAGDVYQVNLSQRFRLRGVGAPLALYAAVRRANPAPYAALLRWTGGAVASFSPELFLQLHGGRVLTRPIKGTRPRTGVLATDQRQRRELLASEKEAAELAMIVDLHRNDLGRVCRYGSVRVTHPRRVEVHPTVFHTVADVVGRLRPECDGLDLLAASFPAGSVTGVPKIRALEIIAELEPAPRGVYTGAIGVLGLDGGMTFNVAIRTLEIRGSDATLHVGGGIVADSTPGAEYEETLAKGRGILRGVAPVAGAFGRHSERSEESGCMESAAIEQDSPLRSARR